MNIRLPNQLERRLHVKYSTLLLVFYEIKKISHKKFFCFLIATLSVLCFFSVQFRYEQNSLFGDIGGNGFLTVFNELYLEMRGEITDEKINDIMIHYENLTEKVADRTASSLLDNENYISGNIWMDYYAIRDVFINSMEYNYTYQNIVYDIIERTIENSEIYNVQNNTYKYNESLKTYEIFSNREISDFYYYEPFLHQSNDILPSILTLIVCVYLCANILIIEKESYMNYILFTTQQGRSKMVYAKILALFILCICTVFWFLFVEILSMHIIYPNMDGGMLPLYAIEKFYATPLNLTVWEYVFLSTTLRCFGAFVCSCIGFACFLLFKNSFSAFLFVCFIFSSFVFLNIYYENTAINFLVELNPVSLMNNSTLFQKMKFYNVFSMPIHNYIISLGFGVILIIISFCVILNYRKFDKLK